MRCAVCNYYTWSYFIAFAEIFVSFKVASALLACSRVNELDRDIACYDGELGGYVSEINLNLIMNHFSFS